MSGAIVLLLAAVFGMAAVSKMRARARFVAVLRNLVPWRLAGPASILIPGVELLLAGFLLSGLAPQKAIVAAIALLFAFTLVLLDMRRRGVKGCACFGESADKATAFSGIVRNLALIAAAIFALCATGPVSFTDPDFSSLLGRITIVLGAFCLWPCLVALANVYKQFSDQTKA